MSKKLLVLLIPLIVLLITCLAILGFVSSDSGENLYLEHMSFAERYYASGDYDNAISYYRKAIEADKTQEAPYINLAQVYYNRGDITNAIEVLRLGEVNVGSDKIKNALALYISYRDDGNTEATISKTANTDDVGKFNTSLIESLSTYDYSQYKSKYTVENEKYLDGIYSVRYLNLDIEFKYQDSTEFTVIDKSISKPYDIARPTEITILDLELLITGVSTGVTADDLRHSGATDVKVKESEGQDKYVIEFNYKNCAFIISCDENGTIKGSDSYNKIVPLANKISPDKKIVVRGNIINVQNANPVNNAELIFRKGKNVRSGQAVDTCVVQNGTYEIELPVGDYTVEVNASGFTKEYFELHINNSGNVVEENFSISPVLASGDIRIVLEWGATPNDLDSHLVGTNSDGQSINVYFVSPKAGNTAELDVDDTNGYGPETTTVHDRGGAYKYRVHRYSGAGSIATSGATVKVYTSGNSQPMVISAPSNAGDWWDVFDIENGQIVNINGNVAN